MSRIHLGHGLIPLLMLGVASAAPAQTPAPSEAPSSPQTPASSQTPGSETPASPEAPAPQAAPSAAAEAKKPSLDVVVPGGWELAGIYDATSVALGREAESWLWRAAPGMDESCGVAKAPDGLGVMEAQAVANRLSPTLAILLRSSGEMVTEPLDTTNVRLAMAGTTLAPMVEPGWTRVLIDGDGLPAHKELLRTQAAMELCMQHKTGRFWVGGDRIGLREAFLLDQPDAGRPSDRMYFRGQADPVPALLGPIDACFERDASGEEQQRAAAGLSLVPADVWGAGLRACPLSVTSAAQEPSPSLPLARRLGDANPAILSATVAPPRVIEGQKPTWKTLHVKVQPALADTDVQIEVSYDGVALGPARPLFKLVGEASEARLGIEDVLAMVPARYPALSDPETPGQTVVLLVPNWQLVEARHRAEGRAWQPDIGVEDGVRWVLENPDQLKVQVGRPGSGSLPNLASKYSGWDARLLSWGYTVGMYAGRSEIVLATSTEPDWAETERAQRAREHALFIGSAAVLLLLLLPGLTRLSDLWSRVPEERVSYWPGAEAEPAGGAGGAPATPLGGAGEGEG